MQKNILLGLTSLLGGNAKKNIKDLKVLLKIELEKNIQEFVKAAKKFRTQSEWILLIVKKRLIGLSFQESVRGVLLPGALNQKTNLYSYKIWED